MKKYSKDHQWVQEDGETARIGITDYAAEQLGDIVFVELPSVGDKFLVGDAMAQVESVKSTSEIYTPISGTVLAMKEELIDTPELLNGDPEGEAWIIELRVETTLELELNHLMSKEEYLASLSSE